MKKRIKQFRILDEEILGGYFEDALNQELRDRADQDPEVTFYDGKVRIEYTATFDLEEPPVEEKGVTFTCGDCPISKPITKRDGSPDERRKIKLCELSEYGRVNKNAKACGILYEMISSGVIYLATIEEEHQEEPND